MGLSGRKKKADDTINHPRPTAEQDRRACSQFFIMEGARFLGIVTGRCERFAVGLSHIRLELDNIPLKKIAR